MTRLGALLFVGLVAFGGCSSDAAEPATDSRDSGAAEQAPFELSAAPVETTEVTAVKSYKFDPEVISIDVGAEVTWANEDDFPHNVHFLTGRDEVLDLPIGEEVAVTFDEPGDFYYECSIHPQQMRGKVIVGS